MQKRALTINFERSVLSGVPEEMEVAIAALSSPNAPTNNATLIDGPTTVTIVLANATNPVTFMVTPTDHPDLTVRVPYRIAWRKKYMGRQFTKDFVMPDFDVDYDDLEDLGQIIGGESYLQWSDRSNPGGIAGLNDAGQVIDSDGNVVSGAEAASTVQGNLDGEIVARQQADEFLRQYFLQFAQNQIAQVYQSTTNSLQQAIGILQSADVIEKAQRIAAVNAVNATLSALTNATNSQVADINEALDAYDAQLVLKADLVGGKVPSSQLPDVALGRAVPVANQAAMLALTSNDVQPGDFAVRPDGVWFLNALPTNNIGNWVQFTVGASVFSINGLTGAVVLSAADVGARSASVPVPQADVSGLTSALNNKTDATTTATLTGRVTAIESDGTYVKKVAGLIPRADMPADAVFVNSSDLVTKKDGTVLNVGGGGTLDIEDVTGLQAILTDNGLTSSSNLDGRLSAAEQAIEDLEPGGGGGTGSSAKTQWWSGVAVTTDLTTVQLRSPFGWNGTAYYYDPDGVDPEDAAYAHIDENGHLTMVRRNEANPPTPVKATQSDLTALTAVVGTKANQSDMTAANAAIATKASSAALDALEDVVDTKASTTALNSLTDAVSLKANQSAVDALTTTVGTKANQADLTSLTTVVNGKANASHTHAQTDITGLVAALSGKANTSHTHAQADITGLSTVLAAKADLSGGTVPLSQLPSLPFSKIADLQNTFDTKADLVAGVIPTSQIPAQAFHTAVPVSSRSAMLALTTSQVQIGDVAVITATADKGSYILNSNDPSSFANWIKLVVPDDTVQSVNGQSGTVVLSASNVGARSSSDPIPQSDVTGLSTALAAKADTSAVTTALATKTAPADVQSILTEAVIFKQKADLVATTAVASLSGQQSIDSTLAPLGTVVLLTAQSSSVNNGLWIVNSGAWTRVADMAVGSYFVRGSVVAVTGGVVNASTLWQETNNSGIVGTNANNWTKILTAGAPPVYTASLGVQRVGNDFRAQVVSGGGLNAVAGGLQRDPNVLPGKFAIDVPAGSTLPVITHNLNSLDVTATFRDKASGDSVLVGWRPTGVNTISAEFASAPATGQYRVTVIG